MEETTNVGGAEITQETPPENTATFSNSWTPESTNNINYDEIKMDGDDDDELVEKDELNSEKQEAEPKVAEVKEEEKKENSEELTLSSEELKTMQNEYNEMKTFFENIQKNPAILKELYEKFVPQQPQPQLQPKEIENSWDNFTEEEFNDPKSFANGIRQRMLSEVQNQVKPVIEFTNYMAQYLPHMQNAIQSFYIEQGNRAMSELRNEFGSEIEPYLKEGTIECKQFTDKIRNNPQLTPKEAFLLVKPQFINKEVNTKVANALAQKRSQSLSSSPNRNGLVKSEKITNISDALAKVFQN